MLLRRELSRRLVEGTRVRDAGADWEVCDYVRFGRRPRARVMLLLPGLLGLPSAAWAQSGNPAPANPLYIQMIPFVLIIFIFYFLILRPQQKRQRTLQKMIEGLKKGDRVLTGGGIYGTVFLIKDDTLVLEIGKDVKVEFAKSAVTAVVPAE